MYPKTLIFHPFRYIFLFTDTLSSPARQGISRQWGQTPLRKCYDDFLNFHSGSDPIKVALQLMSYIKKQMDENGLFSNYTMQSLLDELDIIEYYQQPGKTHHLSEITEKQKELYRLMDVEVPT